MILGRRIFDYTSRGFFTSSAVLARTHKHIVDRLLKKPVQLQVGDSRSLLPKKPISIPLYPYGESRIYKQSNKGLYGGRFIQFGNKISKKEEQKNRRSWHPNVQRHKLWSDALGKALSIKVVNKVLKTITKEGGLDNYLIKDKSARIKELGPYGWELRYKVLKALERKETESAKETELAKSDTIQEPASVSTLVFNSKNGQTYTIVDDRKRILDALLGLYRQYDNSLVSHFKREYKDKDTSFLLSELEELNYDLHKLETQKSS